MCRFDVTDTTFRLHSAGHVLGTDRSTHAPTQTSHRTMSSTLTQVMTLNLKSNCIDFRLKNKFVYVFFVLFQYTLFTVETYPVLVPGECCFLRVGHRVLVIGCTGRGRVQ